MDESHKVPQPDTSKLPLHEPRFKKLEPFYAEDDPVSPPPSDGATWDNHNID